MKLFQLKKEYRLVLEAATRVGLWKKVILEISQNSQANTCVRVPFSIRLQAFIKKEAVVQVFSCEICEISKNAIFTEHLWTTASVLYGVL